MSLLFASDGQGTGASALAFPMNIQDSFPLGLTGLISLLSKGLSRVPTLSKFNNAIPQLASRNPHSALFWCLTLSETLEDKVCLSTVSPRTWMTDRKDTQNSHLPPSACLPPPPRKRPETLWAGVPKEPPSLSDVCII